VTIREAEADFDRRLEAVEHAVAEIQRRLASDRDASDAKWRG
jgi:hypothetical protein